VLVGRPAPTSPYRGRNRRRLRAELAIARVAAIWLAFATPAALLAGCGTSGKPPSVSASTRAEAVAYAAAVNLRGGDVAPLIAPRFPRLARLPRNRETRYGPLGACDGDAAGPVIGITSQRFARNNERHEGAAVSITLLPIESVRSTVYLAESTVQMSKELASIESGHARECVKRAWSRLVSSDEHKIARIPLASDIEVAALPAPIRQAASFGVRTTLYFAEFDTPGTPKRINYFEDFVGFVLGRALIVLNTTGDPRPVPAATERRLLSLLYSRANAHRL
jgi:hypothetical protein